jgi:hypothetical protein
MSFGRVRHDAAPPGLLGTQRYISSGAARVDLWFDTADSLPAQRGPASVSPSAIRPARRSASTSAP